MEEDEESTPLSTSSDQSDLSDQSTESTNRINFGADEQSTTQTDPPRKRRRMRGCLLWLLTGVIITLAVLFYLRYLNPYVTDARDRVYIERVEKRGIIFKTYEVQAVRPDLLNNNSTIYSPAETFSVANDSLAIRLQDLQNTGHIVTITYERFYGILPWRGASHNVITAIE